MVIRPEELFKNGKRDPVRDRLIKRKGANIFYRFRPSVDKRLSIAFQGGYSTHPAAWMGQIKRFRGEISILTMENRGHWHSGIGNSNPKTYLKDMAEDFLAIMDLEKIDKITICGHSMWGGNAMRFYHMFPNRVEGLVLVSPAYIDPRKQGFLKNYWYLHPLTDLLAWASAGLGPLNGFKSRVLAENRASWEIMRSALLMTYMREAEDPEHALKMIKNVYRADIRAMSMSMRALLLMDDELYERAGEIKVPVHLIAGTDDMLISPESTLDLAKEIPGAITSLFQESAHFSMLSKTECFNNVIESFMRRLNISQGNSPSPMS
jgi:pimeloyl-ACP methyl ester carboxylesterase